MRTLFLTSWEVMRGCDCFILIKVEKSKYWNSLGSLKNVAPPPPFTNDPSCLRGKEGGGAQRGYCEREKQLQTMCSGLVVVQRPSTFFKTQSLNRTNQRILKLHCNLVFVTSYFSRRFLNVSRIFLHLHFFLSLTKPIMRFISVFLKE